MDRTHTTGWAIGAGLVAGLVAGGAMQLLGYPFLAAGAAAVESVRRLLGDRLRAPRADAVGQSGEFDTTTPQVGHVRAVSVERPTLLPVPYGFRTMSRASAFRKCRNVSRLQDFESVTVSAERAGRYRTLLAFG